MADTDPVADALSTEKISQGTKAQLWDAFQKAQNPDELQKLIAPMAAPNSIKATLWDMKQKSMSLTTGDPFLKELEMAQATGQNPAGPTLTDRAVESLPAAGGVVGGVLGGAGGTAFGIGFGGVPGAIAGATLGGAAGAAAKQTINRLRGTEAPSSATDAALDIGKEGALQGALEGAGGLAVKGAGIAGHALMEHAIGAAPSLAERFPNIAKTAIEERLPVGNVLPGGTKGSAMAVAARKASAQDLTQKLIAAGQQGQRFDPAAVTQKPIQDLLDELAKNPVGDADEQKIVDLTAEFLRRHPGPVTPEQLKGLKQAAQAIASPIYKAVARGEAVGTEQAIKAKFNSAVATGSKDALETIPGVAENEARTQGLIGAAKGIKRAELRRLSGTAEALSGVSGVLAGVLSPRGDLPSDVRNAAVTWLVTRGLMSPRSTSRAALALTQPQLKALFAQFPRLAYEVTRQMTE